MLFRQPGSWPALITEHGTLLCPICREESYMEGGDSPVEVGPDRDEYESPIGTRGGWLATRPWCSNCWVDFRLVIANHKGTILLGMVKDGEHPRSV